MPYTHVLENNRMQNLERNQEWCGGLCFGILVHNKLKTSTNISLHHFI